MTYAFAGALTGLVRGRFGRHGFRPAPGRHRLQLPPALRTERAYDAVGIAERHGPGVMALLPRAGCVLAGAGYWWWIVPPQSDVGVSWPAPAVYAVGAMVTGPPGRPTGPAGAEEPGVVHWPGDEEPYTHPLLLHIAVCAAAGVSPAWPCDERLPRS
ncbi:hypothetical protein GCM10009548_57740 [Streptomyces malaysiensis subsp. malaysiensis]|uniref:Integral membrane protein n=1 Tax=Streptomyces malaysiensis TaxID=92644 RepID=A0ABX6WG09_STRMQ|nr:MULTISPECIES: hypothetical protein [Streptomyces]QPI60375.1 hypothetical protein I1A49_40595 [Streptomyces solisilvae]UHH22082.1 hypothetical protein LUV23_40745 [Streptomyces sp. HNM0561]